MSSSPTTVKIGFIPSNWEAWDGSTATGRWAGPMRDRCIAALAGVPGLELISPPKEMTGDGCVSDVVQARKVLEYFRDQRIQGILLGNMTFGQEVSAVGTLVDGLSPELPILHFATRSGPIGTDGSRSTDTWCGQFMTTSALKRRGRIFTHLRTCNPEEPQFRQSVAVFTRAVNAIARFRHARFGQLGTRPALFESQVWNEQQLQKQFGQMVVPMDLDTVLNRVETTNADDPEVRRTEGEIRAMASRIDEDRPGDLLMQARYEVALKRIVAELDVQAIAVNCWTRLQERFGISACSTFARLNDQGLITACEVDVLGAITMWAIYQLGLGLTPPDFIDWTDMHPSQENVWLAWHCGNAAPSLCAKGCKQRLTRNERMIQWCPTCHGALEQRLRNGPVTCGRLVEYDGKFSFFFGRGEVVDIPPFVRGAYGWVKVADLGDWEDKMVEHGVIHHGVLIHDPLVAEALPLFCRFLGIQAVQGA